VAGSGQLSGPARGKARCGAVLIEVILAVGLFVAAAAVITSSLNSAVERAARLRLQTHALNLASSVLAEIQMGARPIGSAGPEPFEAPFESWTWQIESIPYSFGAEEIAGLQFVTVIVRHTQASAAQRLTQIVPVPTSPGIGSEPASAAVAAAIGFGPDGHRLPHP